MLRGIEFKHGRFTTKNDDNLFSGLTGNIVILCNCYELMDFLAKEILKTVNGEADYNDFDCDDCDEGSAKAVLRFGLQRMIAINAQRITLSLEPAIVYKARRLKDIWFFDYAEKENGNESTVPDSIRKVCLYPLHAFIDSDAVWGLGLDEVYKYVVGGRYGTYDGKWVDLKLD